jgi:TM2 domain-containing membrane protein YozV
VPSDDPPRDDDDEQRADRPTTGAEASTDADEDETGEVETIGADPARDLFSTVEEGPDGESGDEAGGGSDAEAAGGGSDADAADSPDATEPGERASDAASATDSTAAEDADGLVYCRQCGERIAPTAETCPNCGAPQDAEPSGRSGDKDPGIAAIASLIVPGAGQLYNGQFVRGAAAFVGVGVADVALVLIALVFSLILVGPLFLLLIPVVHVLVAYDAYDQAQKINRGEVDPGA